MKTGIINIDKSEGMISTNAVAAVKRLTHVSGCGHMGTLDPMASGVLPVAVGNASRLFDYFLAKHKTYVAEFTFGLASDTLDTTGNVEPSGRIPEAAEIEAALPRFLGETDQIPPRYSAKWVNGRRGYDLAREGRDFELKPAKITIYSFKMLGPSVSGGPAVDNAAVDNAGAAAATGAAVSDAAAAAASGRFRFEIECSGGTYIRSLARDLGEALGTSAVMSALRRTKSGPFTEENAVKLESLTEENIESFIIPTQDVLDMREVHVSGRDEHKLLCGVNVPAPGKAYGVYKMFLEDGTFYGLCEVTKIGMKVVKKLC